MLLDRINNTFILVTVTLLLFKLRQNIFRYVLLLLTIDIVKHITEKKRPNGRDYLSFPSGHAATAWFIAVFYKWNPILVLWAILVSAARVKLKYHHIQDVIVGAIFGIVFASY
jgi:membrane-associated phospholipid phosphatase